MNRAFVNLDRLIGGITASLLAIAFLLTLFSVFTRYVATGLQVDWILEVVVFTNVWAILLGIARVERRGAHIRLDALFGLFGPRAKQVAETVALLVGLAVSLFLIVAGWLVVRDSIAWDEHTDSTLRLPLWVYYSALSTCFGVHAIFVLRRLFLTIRGQEEIHATNLSE